MEKFSFYVIQLIDAGEAWYWCTNTQLWEPFQKATPILNEASARAVFAAVPGYAKHLLQITDVT